jgi:hypothetical protein
MTRILKNLSCKRFQFLSQIDSRAFRVKGRQIPIMKDTVFILSHPFFDLLKELILAAKCASDLNVQKMGFQLLISWVDNDNISLEEDILALSAIYFNNDNEDLIWWWLQLVSRALNCQNLDQDRKPEPTQECATLARKVFKYGQKIIMFIKTEIEESWKEEDLSPEMSNFDEFRVCGALSGLCARIINSVFLNHLVTQYKL